jgi:acyl transferase domain-containing protein
LGVFLNLQVRNIPICVPEKIGITNITRLLSDTGRSFAFDNRGTGFGRGEGCGMLVLKPLDQAIKDNDTVRAVIMATGLNQDGKTPGITMPNGAAQGELAYDFDPQSKD